MKESKIDLRVVRKGKRVQLHRWLMEQHMGRKLTDFEIVHHKDENRKNNNLSNLEVMSIEEHTSHHQAGRKRTHTP